LVQGVPIKSHIRVLAEGGGREDNAAVACGVIAGLHGSAIGSANCLVDGENFLRLTVLALKNVSSSVERLREADF